MSSVLLGPYSELHYKLSCNSRCVNLSIPNLHAFQNLKTLSKSSWGSSRPQAQTPFHSSSDHFLQCSSSLLQSSSRSNRLKFLLLISSFQSKFPSKPISSNVGLSQILYTPKLTAGNSSLTTKFNAHRSASRFRFFSFKTPGFGGQINGNFAKKVLDKPAAAVSSAFSRYREAIGLQIEAFFKRNYLVLLGFGAALVCALLWRIMFGIANTFVGLSEGMAKYGFLALSSAIVAFAVSVLYYLFAMCYLHFLRKWIYWSFWLSCWWLS